MAALAVCMCSWEWRQVSAGALSPCVWCPPPPAAAAPGAWLLAAGSQCCVWDCPPRGTSTLDGASDGGLAVGPPLLSGMAALATCGLMLHSSCFYGIFFQFNSCLWSWSSMALNSTLSFFTSEFNYKHLVSSWEEGATFYNSSCEFMGRGATF